MKLVALFQISVPLLLIVLVTLIRKPSRLHWLLNTLAFGMVIAFLWASARWDLVSMYLRPVFPLLFLVGAGIGFKRIQKPEKPARRIAVVIEMTITIGLIVLMSGFCFFSFRGFLAPVDTVNLRSPLPETPAVVLNGGVSPFTNGHYKTRAQGYALDILGQNGFGASASLFADRSKLSSYPIFGAPIFSPCDGIVTAAVGNFEDLTPPATDTSNPAGNYVLLECRGFEVLLAHLKYESLAVQVGDSVDTHTRLGQVGNTGNTSEPHLHIHAEAGGEPGKILDGKSVPIAIEGRFLVRGDLLDG